MLTATFDGATVQANVEVMAPILEFSSPSHGEDDVAVTRETVLKFSAPLDPATVNDQTIFAEFAGTRLPAVLHLSNDQQRVRIFYDDPRVLYVSTHQYPFYPGTGALTEVGAGQGEGKRRQDRAYSLEHRTSHQRRIQTGLDL